MLDGQLNSHAHGLLLVLKGQLPVLKFSHALPLAATGKVELTGHALNKRALPLNAQNSPALVLQRYVRALPLGRLSGAHFSAALQVSDSIKQAAAEVHHESSAQEQLHRVRVQLH